MLGPEYGGPRFCETPVIIYSSKWHNIQEKPSLQLLSRKKKTSDQRRCFVFKRP